jgi:mono/diheme cytochrome c family protein
VNAKPRTVAVAVALVATTALVAACGPSRLPPPRSAPAGVDTAAERRGELVYMRHCDSCHPSGAAGLGPSLNDKPLPKVLVKAQVRNGLGAMPAFGEEKISDDDLEALGEYVGSLRR